MSVTPISSISANNPSALSANRVESTSQDAFKNVLKNAMEEINDNMTSADNALNSIVTGDSVDYHEFLIRTEKTAMTLQLTLEIRNKIIDAYNEIMRMQL